MRDKLFYSICFSFAIGVLLRSFVFIDPFYIAVVALISTFLIFLSYFVFRNKIAILVCVSILVFLLGILRFNMIDKPTPLIYESQVGQKANFSAIITDEPSIREKNQQLTVQTLNSPTVNMILSTNLSTEYKYGDEINYSGLLEKPDNFTTDQGKEFDYVNYLRKDGILYVMKNPKTEIISRGGGSKIKQILFFVKDKFIEKINAAIPGPESLLMGGLILGEKSSFSQALRQSFVNTGTIHIVALSGYNVTIVAEWIMKGLVFLPINFAIGAGILSIILFIIMTGGVSTAIRAGVMATLALVARATGRNYDAGRALLLAGVGMIFLNPLILAFDVSFQLSFLATIAVIFISPKFDKYFLWIKWKWLRDIFTITIAAYIFVMPFILYKMGNLSIVALPANILVLPLIPATMILGFVTGFAGLVSSVLAMIPGKISYFMLHYELATIGFFSHLPSASFSIPDFPLILVLFIYAIFVYRIFFYNYFNKKGFARYIYISFVVFTLTSFSVFFLTHIQSRISAERELQSMLTNLNTITPSLGQRTESANCFVNGPFPDKSCSPGAVFTEATPAQICVSGYTKKVRKVSTNLRKKVYAEYNISYPVPFGSYEVDHIIPLELGGNNDIANLFPEAANPTPGFHEKDIVENYLNQEVCAGRADLSTAQYQIATDWLAVYNRLSPEEIAQLKKKYTSWSQ